MSRPRPKTTAEALEFFGALSPSTIRLGLDRVRAALTRLGEPQRRYRGLQVAGTNGKGSTCAFADAMLRAAGFKVGLYTSPHLERVNERIRVGGVEIDDDTFGARILEVIDRCPELRAEPPELTYFEVGTLVALWHFAQVRVDVAVLETGLGGRLDATTAAHADVTAITSLSMDHMQYLGDTLPQIAAEKAGILRPRVPLILARQPADAQVVVQEHAEAVGAPVLREGEDFALERRADGTLTYRGPSRRIDHLALGLRGEHQVQNAAVAITSVLALGAAGLAVGDEAIRAGLRDARWPARLEELPGTPTILLDGAHNEGGAEVLRRALDTLYAGRDVHCVFGVLADKDHAAIRATLFPRCASIHLCPVPSPRTLAPEASLREAQAFCDEVACHPDWQAALAAARRRAKEGDVVLCTGSLYLIGLIRGFLRG